MKKVFLLGTLLATLLIVSVPTYACDRPAPTSPKTYGWIETDLAESEEVGYTLVYVSGTGNSCGPFTYYIKTEVLVVIVTVSGILGGIILISFLRKKRTKK